MSKLLKKKNEQLFFNPYVPLSNSGFDKFNSGFTEESIFFISANLIKIDKVKFPADKILDWAFFIQQNLEININWDIDKCRKMKAEIEAEIEREKANDLFDDL